jgi:two-component system, sensor histidine kinase and response regulator
LLHERDIFMDDIDLSTRKPLIFIIDDIMENVKILGSILLEQGYDISMANNGAMALKMIEKISPDLVLLDIMMPDINGFEVCRQFKEMEKMKSVPVIFLTARSDSEDIIKGFQLGGVDYIIKPFNNEELIVRVKTHIDLKLSKDLILQQNQKLKKLNDEKNELLGIAAHDLRNPLTGIIVSNDAVIKFIEKLSKEEISEFSHNIKASGKRMMRIINNLLDIYAIEDGKIKFEYKNFDINRIIKKVLKENELRAESKRISIIADYSPGSIVYADDNKVEQIIDNLLSNAIKFSPFDKKIWINKSIINDDDGNRIRIEIRDEGPGLTDEDQSRLFNKFAKLSAVPTDGEGSTGLGLSIVKRLVEEMNGNVHCESEKGFGASFIVELPSGS